MSGGTAPIRRGTFGRSQTWVPGALTGVPSLGDITAQVSHALHVLHSLNPQLSCSWLVTGTVTQAVSPALTAGTPPSRFHGDR